MRVEHQSLVDTLRKNKNISDYRLILLVYKTTLRDSPQCKKLHRKAFVIAQWGLESSIIPCSHSPQPEVTDLKAELKYCFFLKALFKYHDMFKINILSFLILPHVFKYNLIYSPC